MKKILTLLLLLIATVNSYSQFSKTHYIPPLTGATYMSSTTIDVDQYIYISTPSTTPVTVTITLLGGAKVVNTVTNSAPWVYIISAPSIPDPSATIPKPKPNKPAKDGNNTQLFVPAYLLGTVLKDRGYLIEASDFVYANLRVSSKVSSGGSSQAGGLVAKGISAYGTEFRIGGMENRGVMGSGNGEALMNFASFVATEDNTTVTITLPKVPTGTFMYPKTMNGNYPYGYPFPNSDFSYPPSGAPAPTSYTTPTYKNHIYNGPITVTLNKNESYVVAMENSSDTTFESNYMLGGLITSDRNIVVNCGSIGGTSQIKGEVLANAAPYNNAGKDFGFDQIVGADKIGKEFIFVGGSGMAAATKAYDLERSIIVANVNGTQIFKNGSTTATATINAGDYYVFNGNDYLNGNLYVKTSENVFAYQAIAGIGSSGKADSGNQNMYFVPPLNCATPSAVNNIPLIDEIGITTNTNYDTTIPLGSGGSKNGKVIYSNTVVNIVTQKFMTDGVTANKVYINGVELTPTTPGLIQRTNVTGKTDIPFVAYSYKTTGGNMSITASAQVYVSYYGSNDNAAFGSYFSGFDTKPSITAPIGISNSICIDGTTPLSVTSAVATDEFQWNFNSAPITGATGNTYIPKSIANGGKGPGYYTVTKKSACTNTESLPIPVSECPANDDTDPVLNNIDADSDNDGISNANESYGNLPVDLSNPAGGTLTAGGGAYTNTYTGTTTPAGTGSNTFTGTNTGSYTSNLAAGNTNALTYALNFNKPTSIGIQYNPAGATTASQSNATFEVKTSLNTTITILNPTNQLLIDTDNDGIFESGVTEFSSYDVKFKLNPTVLLPTIGTPPAIDFKIQTYLATSISFAHQNISSSLPNTASFNFVAVSIPKDSDGDLINDQVDTDSDGDGILDIEEGQIGNKTIVSPFTDANKNGLADSFEPAIAPIDTDLDLVPDYLDLDTDNDGILDSAEKGTGPTALDTDSDGIKNYRELDSDGDTCNDVAEAGFTDPNTDGILGIIPVTVDAKGQVTSKTDGYTVPSGNELITAVPVIVTQPTSNTNCATGSAVISMTDNGGNIYKWEVSTDGTGTVWAPVTNNATYAGATTNTLSITGATNGYQYRVGLSNAASACKSLLSNVVTVILSGSPVVTDVTMEQCDADLDGMTPFDLTSKNTTISTNSVNETFTYYTTKAGAQAATASLLIPNPTTYTNATAHAMDVWARVVNPAGCYNVAKIALTVGVQIPASYVFPTPPAPVCDDAAQDGVTAFNLTATKAAFDALFPAATPNVTYTVTFYPTALDATNQTAAITNLAAYRNTIANTQSIWVRVNNSNAAFSGCTTQNTFFSLNVEALPVANAVSIPNQCDDNHDGKFSFVTTNLEATVLGGQTGKTVTYFDAANAPLKDANGVLITSPFPSAFITASQTITAVVTNNTTQKCSAKTSIVFTVETKPTANPVTIASLCDDNHDGKVSFNTTTLEATVLGTQSLANVTVTYFDAANAPLQDANGVLITSPFPTNFITTSQTIKAVVTNNTGLKCSESTNIKFVVETLPTANAVSIPKQCDDNHDGKLSFPTTTLEATVLGGQTGVTVTYFDATNAPLKDANGTLITSPFPTNFVTTSQTIKAVVTNNAGLKCSESTNIVFTVETLPTANAVSIPKQCDDNRDGKLSFPTTTLESTLLNGQTGVTVTYFDSANAPLKDANGVLITSPFPTNFITTSQTIKAVVTNNAGLKCSESTNIVFTVEALPTANPVIIPIQCDDNKDGKLSFNTTGLESTILGGQTGVTVTYFDAANTPLKDANGVLITSPFPNAFVTTSQTIKAVVTNNTPQKCSDQTTIQFSIEALPTANPVTVARQCDDDQDGIFTFNTSTLHATVIGTQTGKTVTYFDQAGTPLATPFPATFTTTSQTIKAVVANNTGLGCSDQTLIVFGVDAKPVANPVTPVADCDNELDPMLQDGKLSFNTSSIQATVLGTQTGMVVKYYDQANVPLSSPLPNPFVTGTQTIKVVVENPLNTSCPATEFINFIVNPLPKIDLNAEGNDDKIICSNISTLTFDLNASIQDGTPTTNYTYQWSKDGLDLAGETAYTLAGVNTAGIYRVVVTTPATGCNRTRTINVDASERAEIASIIVNDLTDVNTVTINLEPGLKGDYEYSIDDEIGYYQDSNIFKNVSPGKHLVYIRDKNGCGIKDDITAVIGVPKFFTPNSDGYNDYWDLKGMDTMKYTIFIYDRYGKLLKEIIPSTQGWDGIFNGAPLPGTDYWYSLELENGRTAKGHFSLKR